MPKAYPAEFRETVLEVYRSGDRKKSEVAKDFGISMNCLDLWVKKEARVKALGPDGVDPEVELRRVKKELVRANQEIEILRRAAAYFARDTLPK